MSDMDDDYETAPTSIATLHNIETMLKHAQQVMRDLGVGHRESIYARALTVALNGSRIVPRTEVDIPILFRGQCIGHGRADLIVDNVIVEIKAVRQTPGKDALAQLHKYVENLSAVEHTFFQGIIVNFNQKNGLLEVCAQRCEAAEKKSKQKSTPAPVVVKSRFFATIKKK